MFLADVGSTLGVLNVPEDVIRDVMTMLEENADALEERNPNPINGAVFGGSSWGSQLGLDAGRAQKVASKEILEMVAGLRGYSQSIEKFREEVTEADASNASTMAQFQAATECVASPTFSSPGQCTVPTDGGEG